MDAELGPGWFRVGDRLRASGSCHLWFSVRGPLQHISRTGAAGSATVRGKGLGAALISSSSVESVISLLVDTAVLDDESGGEARVSIQRGFLRLVLPI